VPWHVECDLRFLFSSLGTTCFITFLDIKLSSRLRYILAFAVKLWNKFCWNCVLQTRILSCITLLPLFACLTSWLSDACLMHVPATSANGYSLQDNNDIRRQGPCNVIPVGQYAWLCSFRTTNRTGEIQMHNVTILVSYATLCFRRAVEYIVTCTPLIRRVLVRMIGFIIRWLHTHS
jgi:hypothetical protein